MVVQSHPLPGHVVSPERDAVSVTSPDLEPPALSIVIPCLNEARSVGACVTQALQAMATLAVRGEVVVADNGSTDGSLEAAAGRGARVVRVACRGYGSALRGGVAAAAGRFVIVGDADGEHDFGPVQLARFLERLAAGDEIVIGNRFLGGIQPGAMKFLNRYVGNPLLSGLLNLFFRTPIKDVHCGMRAFRKDAYDRLGLTSVGMEFASEMVIKAQLQRLRMSEVSVVQHPDGAGRTPHLRPLRDGWRHLRLLLMLCPFWLYLIPAGALLLTGLGLGAWQAFQPPGRLPPLADAEAVALGALCSILGYQTAWFWAFAKLYGWSSGLLPPDTFHERVFRHFNLERGLMLGAGLLALGVILQLALFASRARAPLAGSREFLGELRLVIWSISSLILGAQTIFGSFFASMMGLASRASR